MPPHRMNVALRNFPGYVPLARENYRTLVIAL